MPPRLLSVLCLCLLSLSFSAQGKSRELWAKEIGSVSGPEWLGQLVADKTGGVAATFTEIINEGQGVRNTVVWLNVNGKEIHRKSFELTNSNGYSWELRIIAATRLGLVVWYFTDYSDGVTQSSETVVISRAGEEAEIDEVTPIEGLRNGQAPNVFHDASGFFSFRLSEDKRTVSVVRRSFR